MNLLQPSDQGFVTLELRLEIRLVFLQRIAQNGTLQIIHVHATNWSVYLSMIPTNLLIASTLWPIPT